LNRGTGFCRPLPEPLGHTAVATLVEPPSGGPEGGDPEAELRGWSGWRDSNPRPSPWQGDALPTEPHPREASTIATPERLPQPSYPGVLASLRALAQSAGRYQMRPEQNRPGLANEDLAGRVLSACEERPIGVFGTASWSNWWPRRTPAPSKRCTSATGGRPTRSRGGS